MIIAKMEVYMIVENEDEIEDILLKLDAINGLEKDGYTTLDPEGAEYQGIRSWYADLLRSRKS